MAGNNALTASGALAAALLESYVEESRAAPSCSPAAILKAVENVRAHELRPKEMLRNPANMARTIAMGGLVQTLCGLCDLYCMALES